MYKTKKVLYTSDLRYCVQTLEVDEENAYVVFKYEKPVMDLILRLHEVYCENKGNIHIKNEGEKEIVIDIAKHYQNFISIEESPSVFGDVYHKIEVLKNYGILDNSTTTDICDAILSPALTTESEVLALKWDMCTSDWYIKNIQAYIADEYKADFIIMLSFYKVLFSTCISTQQCLSALYDILNSIKKEGKKHTYVFKDTTGYYMIGHTKNVPQRYENVRVGNTTLELVCHLDGDYASQIQKKFAHKKVEGIWFDLTHCDIDIIKDLERD